jgi:hypothetical protein
MRHDVGGDDIAVERAGLVLGRPDAHQIAIDLMVLGEPVQGLAGKVLLRHLALELDRIAAVLAHGLSPRKPGPDSPILTSLTVHPQGCTPLGRPAPECVDKQEERQDAPSPTTTNGPQTAGWAVVQCAGRDRSPITASTARRIASALPMLGSAFIAAKALVVSFTAASLSTYQCETSRARAPA